jgi:DNA-directed RNA polymerase specialized sigma subunit
MRMAQIRLLDAIGGLEKSLGRLPSMNEIARVLGCSPQNVHKMIKRMRSKSETLSTLPRELQSGKKLPSKEQK